MWLLKSLALCRVLYLSILIKMWLEGKSVAGKGAHASGIWSSLEKSWFKNLGELHKVGKTWERGYSCRIPNQTTPNQRRHQKVNDIKVNTAIWKSGGREERHRIQGFWGPVWSSCSLCWFRSPCHLLVLVAVCPLWFIKSRLQLSTRRLQSTSYCYWLTRFMEMLISVSSWASFPHYQHYHLIILSYWLASQLVWC